MSVLVASATTAIKTRAGVQQRFCGSLPEVVFCYLRGYFGQLRGLLCSVAVNFMKYIKKSKTLAFTSDEEVLQFHDQLTDAMRTIMTSGADKNISDDEAMKQTKEFFERYSALAETLTRLRAHIPQKPM